jgi:hypothetical protein
VFFFISNTTGCAALQVLGGDLAGRVEEADEGSKFKAGDAVAALTPGFFIFTQDGELNLSHAFELLKFIVIPPTFWKSCQERQSNQLRQPVLAVLPAALTAPVDHGNTLCQQ